MSPAAETRQRFGRYEVLFPIATGGMAEVYAARALGEAGFQKLVALKRMRPELTENVRFTTMFLDEGRMAANITSPNVVSTLDLGRAEDNSLYLVMELVTGASLAGLIAETTLRQETFPAPIAIEILRQAASGLYDAHMARSPAGEPLGIIHRDVSPHNVLVDVNGQVKITDFGIAKALERQTQSQAGEMKGKLSYLSPEQARGRDVDQRTDIFILGIVAWEVLVGERLFGGRGPVEVLHKIASMPIPRVDVKRPELGEAIGDVVARALERDPAARYETARQLGEALARAYGTLLPSRSEVGEFVRQFGGTNLSEIENGLRRAAGGSFDDLPAAEVEPSYPFALSRPSPAPPSDTMPDDEVSDRTSAMSPLELPEEVRANLAPKAPLGNMAPKAPLGNIAPKTPLGNIAPNAPAVPPPPRIPSGFVGAVQSVAMPAQDDFGATIRDDMLVASELDLTPSVPHTMPTLPSRIETYRPPPLEPEPVPERGIPWLAVLGAVGALAIVGMALVGALLALDGPTEHPSGTTAEPPTSVPPSSNEVARAAGAPAPTEESTTHTTLPSEEIAPTEPVEATPDEPTTTGEAHVARGSRRGAREPEGDPPPRVEGTAAPTGDRANAFHEIFGE
ncbi:MAG: protein kinase [Sandaracinaceae bacterium]